MQHSQHLIRASLVALVLLVLVPALESLMAVDLGRVEAHSALTLG